MEGPRQRRGGGLRPEHEQGDQLIVDLLVAHSGREQQGKQVLAVTRPGVASRYKFVNDPVKPAGGGIVVPVEWQRQLVEGPWGERTPDCSASNRRQRALNF